MMTVESEGWRTERWSRVVESQLVTGEVTVRVRVVSLVATILKLRESKVSPAQRVSKSWTVSRGVTSRCKVITVSAPDAAGIVTVVSPASENSTPCQIIGRSFSQTVLLSARLSLWLTTRWRVMMESQPHALLLTDVYSIIVLSV